MARPRRRPFGASVPGSGGVRFSVCPAGAESKGRKIKGGTIRMVPRSLVILIGEK